MDLKELQSLVKREKSRVIIIENGEPVLVVLPYEEYKKEENFENGQALPLKEEENLDQEELTVDDLPL